MQFPEFWPGYETVEVIGTGGFGKVYEIRKKEDESGGEYISALKVISIPQDSDEIKGYIDEGYDEQSISSIYTEQVKEIVSEFELMAQFKGTSNIVSYEDHKIIPHENGIGYDVLIKMEMLTSLPAYFNSHAMTVNDVIEVGKDICHALELCQKKSIIHRDIKPQNIFVNSFDDYKLGDFGIAKSMEATMSATRIGTYSYIAPEVYKDQPYNATVDIYSLGLVLYWMLNDRRGPFLPPAPEIVSPLAKSDALSRRMRGDEIPEPLYGSEELKKVVLKACAYDAKDRYKSATEFKKALAKLEDSDELINEVVASTLLEKSESDVEVTDIEATVVEEVAEDKIVELETAPLVEGKAVEEAEGVEEAESGLFVDEDEEEPPMIADEVIEDDKPVAESVEKLGKADSNDNVVSDATETKKEKKRTSKKVPIIIAIALVVIVFVILLLLKSCDKPHKSSYSKDVITTTSSDAKEEKITMSEDEEDVEETTEDVEETTEDGEVTTSEEKADNNQEVATTKNITAAKTTTTTKKGTTPEEAFAKWKNGTATENDMTIIAGYINSKIASSSNELTKTEFDKKYVYFADYGDPLYAVESSEFASISAMATEIVNNRCGYKISKMPKSDEHWWGSACIYGDRAGYQYYGIDKAYVITLNGYSNGKICYIEDKAEAEKRLRGY